MTQYRKVWLGCFIFSSLFFSFLVFPLHAYDVMDIFFFFSFCLRCVLFLCLRRSMDFSVPAERIVP